VSCPLRNPHPAFGHPLHDMERDGGEDSAVSRRPTAVPALVYELYGLTEEEIRMVENA